MAGTSLTCEGGEQFGKERLVDPVGKIEAIVEARCQEAFDRSLLWPRLLDRIADGDQSVPPALIVDSLNPVKLGKPARNLRSRPKPAVIRRRLDPLRESRPGVRIVGLVPLRLR